MLKGYHQVALEEKSREKAAFATHFGLYQYRRLPFGLFNAPASVQRLLANVLEKFINKFVILYQTFEQHMIHLFHFQTLTEAHLKVKIEKSYFGAHIVELLSHQISANGIEPNTKNIEVVVTFPTPKEVKDI